MSVEEIIQQKLQQNLQPDSMHIENESHMHGGPASESHFNITAVSKLFDQLSQVKRHQHVYGLPADELAGDVQALALHLYTPAEWSARQQAIPVSPDCRGGSKHEQ